MEESFALKTWEPILGPVMQGECPTTIEELLGTVLGINLEGPWAAGGFDVDGPQVVWALGLMVYNWVVYTNQTYAKIACISKKLLDMGVLSLVTSQLLSIYSPHVQLGFPPPKHRKRAGKPTSSLADCSGKMDRPQGMPPRSVDTVDGRNIANKLRLVVDIPLFTGFYASQVQVVQDF